MRADFTIETTYRHPIVRVWAALTSAEALAAWLMPNDFRPVVGHEFSLRTHPAPGFDGIVRCRVLQLDEPTTMVWSWASGAIDTTVTFTLTAIDAQHTRLGKPFRTALSPGDYRKIAALGTEYRARNPRSIA